MKTKKSRFFIGQYVLVSAKCAMKYDENDNRFVKRVPCEPFVGLVVGARHRMLGKFCPPCGVFTEDYEQASLAVSGSVTLWLVRRGFTNATIEVHDDDIRPAPSQILPPSLPWRFCEQPPYDDRVRKELSDFAKAAPRRNGRFVKKTEVQPCP